MQGHRSLRKRGRGRPPKPRSESAPAPKKRQAKLKTNVLPARDDITILVGAKPVGGRGSALATGQAGRKVDWVHAHWVPVDSGKYEDIEANALPSTLHVDNAQMRCLFCGRKRSYNPSTHFKVHLLTACAGFRQSKHWDDECVQQELAMRTSKVRLVSIRIS